jgi:uncharacterized protein (DUF433 family)
MRIVVRESARASPFRVVGLLAAFELLVQWCGRLRTSTRHGASIDSGALEWHAETVSDREARMVFERVTVDPDRMGGAPCIRDLRVPVATVVAMVADGMTVDEILADLPYLEREDITEALRFAAEAVRERELPLRQSA